MLHLMTRRQNLRLIAAAGATAAAALVLTSRRKESVMKAIDVEGADAIQRVTPLKFPWVTRDEIAKAFDDYRRTEFGGWPWPTTDPVLPREEGRYARHADGRVERLG